MTLIYEAPPPAAGAPARRTHVLLIGVGAYTHLLDGQGPAAADDFGLGQLTSPPASARALADWFIDDFTCPDRPLGTVRLLLSEAAPSTYTRGAAATPIAPADAQNVGNALRAWAGAPAAIAGAPPQPATGDPDDQLILYFCGHGLGAGANHLYPLRDFGVNGGDPLGASLNLQKLATGLETVRPSNQLLVMDACRSQDILAAANANDGLGFVTARPERRFGMAQKMAQCIIHSTGEDSVARGAKGQPSLCANALIRALSGAAAKSRGGVWEIKSTLILEAITDLQGRQAPTPEGAQRGDITRFANIAVRRFASPPNVPVFIRYNGGSMDGAEIEYGPPGGALQKVEATGVEWEGEAAIGPHVFNVTAKGGAALCANRQETVAPTYLSLELP